MQVFPKDGWDKRALAYVSAFYGNQLRKGSDWHDIRKVVGINILGGGPREQGHWKDTPGQYVRHYKFQEQLHKKSFERFIDGIELIQYSVMNAPDTLPTSDLEKQDWIAFFKRGAFMNEEQVKSEIHTEAVLKAFERATLSKLPKQVKDDYDAENLQYTQVSEYTAERVAEGEAKGRAEGEAKGRAKGRAEGRAEALLKAARVMKELTNLSNAAIASKLQLSTSQVANIKIDPK
jgi:predicted transposase/invertase (TIGR01784 family)